MKNIEVMNASAGSGKTYRLTHRAVDEIRSGLPAGMLFAATFTHKAAAELSARLRRQLFADDEAEAAELLQDGFVGTVNGTCSRLLTEYAIDAGLSPAIDVIPEENADDLFNRAVSGAIESHIALLEPPAERLNRRGGVSGGKVQLPDWRKDVRHAAEMARINRIDPNALRQCGATCWQAYREMLEKPDVLIVPDALLNEVKKAIPTLEAIEKPTKLTQSVLETLREFVRKATDTLPAWGEWAKLAKLKPGKDGSTAIIDVEEIAKKWLCSPLLHGDLEAMITGVFSCAADALAYYSDFKTRHGLMDFIDQETQTLQLLESGDAFRDSMKERLSLLMVDEFQDTSPMQLALFLELNRLIGKSVWVGDPKQAIYGFRGADPALMAGVVDRIGASETLEYSWRSKENLVAFANAVFTRVFHDHPRESVRLLIPKEREAKAKGGSIESWNLGGGNAEEAVHGLAVAVTALLKRNPELKPADVAILCRLNKDCEKVAAALGEVGLRASAARGLLTNAPVCRLALAALRYMLDERDTVAAAELVKLSPNHTGRGTWLQDILTNRDATLAAWKATSVFQRLDAARTELRHRTPMEALEYAIGAADVPLAAKIWPDTSLALANLDKLRQACVQYMDHCRARRSAAGVAGFIAFLHDSAPGQAEGLDERAVRVLTYHKSKGLEWPVVVLYNLDFDRRADAFGMWPETKGKFDPDHPLAGRSIHFWPDPIPGRQTSGELAALVVQRPEYQTAIEREKAERQRLLYVGITRARDALVFAVRKKTTKSATTLLTTWLDELSDCSGSPLINLPVDNDAGELEQKHALSIGTDTVDITVREYPANMIAEPISDSQPPAYTLPPATGGQYVSARLSPSLLEAELGWKDKVQVTLATDFQARIAVKNKPNYAHLGDAVHGFLGMDKGKLTKKDLLEVAGEVLGRFGVADSMDASDLVATCNRLNDFVVHRYPGAVIRREWPISWRNSRNQLLQGWIDMLIETRDGFVIVDHKTYPGRDAEEHVRQYIPQLAAYRYAVEKATGKQVISVLVHLPMLGQIYELSGLKEKGDEAWI